QQADDVGDPHGAGAGEVYGDAVIAWGDVETEQTCVRRCMRRGGLAVDGEIPGGEPGEGQVGGRGSLGVNYAGPEFRGLAGLFDPRVARDDFAWARIVAGHRIHGLRTI